MDRGIFIFSVQLTTSRIGNLTRLIHTLLYIPHIMGRENNALQPRYVRRTSWFFAELKRVVSSNGGNDDAKGCRRPCDGQSLSRNKNRKKYADS